MSYTFQLVSATIEDRLPGALAYGFDRSMLLEDDFLDTVEPVKLEKRVDSAAVAFLFGRMADKRSICVRIEGIRPKLFFECTGISLMDLKRELQNEVRPELQEAPTGLHIEVKRFANFNGFEPDETTASGRKLHNYYQVEYPSVRSWRKAVNLRKDDDTSIREAHAAKLPIPVRQWRLAHEYNVDPMTRFIREHNLVSGGWNVVSDSFTPKGNVTTCDVEVEAHASGIRGLKDRFDMAPYTVMYYDLETLSLDPENGGIIQVSLVLECQDNVEKHCVCLRNVSPLEGVTLHCVSSEEALLRRVRRVVISKDPDMVVAYNGVNFDNKFLAIRAEARHAAREKIHTFFYLSRFAFRPSRLRELSLASSGMGDNKFDYIDMTGRATIDFFVKFKVDEPSEISWSLSHFTRKYIPGEDKEDMDYREIPILQAGSDDDRRRLASYCVHDSYLLHLLNKARNIIVIILQFAQVFGVLPEWVYFRGQQVRFISQLLEAVRTFEAHPLIIQTPANGFVGMFDSEGFEGATVNDPLAGFYDEDPIATLDWKSLYPSIMLAHNLCHSTHIIREDLRTLEGVVAHRVRGLGMHWREVKLNEVKDPELMDDPKLRGVLQRSRRGTMINDKDGVTSTKRREFTIAKQEVEHVPLTPNTLVKLDNSSHPMKNDDDETVYVQPFGEHTTYFTTSHRGILPTILENLLAERVRCKKEMKSHGKKAKELKESDPAKAACHAAMADVFDGRQLAVKVSANSVYGACGAGATGKCPNKDVSETVTFEGRETMVILKEILQFKYPGIVVIYGDTDSVMVKFDGVGSDISKCGKLAQEAADHVTEEFALRGYPDMILEFEKIFYPYLLLKKKRYIGLKYEPDGDDMMCKGIDAKGVETERKDTLPFLKTIYMDVRNELMYNRDAVAAYRALEKHLWRLIRDEVPFAQLTMSKGLKSSYADWSTQVQCCVNEKKRKREPGSESAVGDRVWYVIVNGPDKAKTTELAEDPDYAKKNGLKLNRLWYFEHAIQRPMTSLFSHIKKVDADKLFDTVIAELKREKVGGTSLRGLVDSEAPSSSTDPLLLPGKKHHVPRPPPPPVRRKKGGAR